MVSMDIVTAESRKRQRTALISRDYNEISRRVAEKNIPKLKLSLNNAAKHFDEYEQCHYEYLDAIRAQPDYDKTLIEKQETSYSQLPNKRAIPLSFFVKFSSRDMPYSDHPA